MSNSVSRGTPPRLRLAACVAACLAVVFLCPAAQAGSTTVLGFGQSNPADVITSTESGGVTTYSTAGNADGGGLSVPITITNFLGAPALTPAFETFVDLHSVGPATTIGGVVIQNFVGTIQITSGVGGTGTNFLTATFTDATAPGISGGFLNGHQAQLAAAGPPDSLVLTSGLTMFAAPTSMAIGLSGVTPSLTTSGGSIGGFTAQNAGTFSATIVPEPASMALLGIGMSGLFALRRLFKRPAVA
jgi:hypothetical protein